MGGVELTQAGATKALIEYFPQHRNSMTDNVSSELKEKAAEWLRREAERVPEGASEAEGLRLIRELLDNQLVLEKQSSELRESKELLQEEYDLFQDIINNQPVGIYRIHVFKVKDWREKAWHSSENPPYKMELASDRFCEILGVTRQEFKANPYVIVDLIVDEDKAGFISTNEEANRNVIPYKWEGRVLVGTETKWVRLESKPQMLPFGGITWTGLLSDITERRLTEEALIETRLKLDEIVEAVHVGIADINVVTGEIDFNQAYPKMLGYTFDELAKIFKESTPGGWRAIVHPDDIPAAEEAHARYMQSNMPYYEHECRLRHKEGYWIWMYQRASLTSRTPDGEPLIISGIHTDISQRKELEKALTDLNDDLEKRIADRTAELNDMNSALLLTEEKFRTVADFTYDWEYWKNPEGKLVYMSPSVERITGYTAEEFIQHPELFDNIVYISDIESWERHKKQQWSNAANDISAELNLRIVKKNGQVRWMGHVCRSINVNGKYLGLRVSNRDITEKIEAENNLLRVTAEVENRERDKLSAELHDGMGPLLSLIKMYFQWLSETCNRDKRAVISQKGNESIEAAIQLTREMARGLSTQLLHKSGYVVAVTDFTTQINAAKKININFVFNESDRFSHFQEINLYRITTELIKNTLTYAQATSVQIVFNIDIIKNSITLFYADNGIGFDWLQIEKSATGLGLMSIENRVRAMRGTLKLESVKGAGMKAYIDFPIEDQVPDAE